MKVIIPLLFLTTIAFGQSLDVDLNKYAWERTAYERWDKWRPWIVFNILNRNYNDEDRRTMPIRSRQMTQWAIYRDQYEILERRTDSLFENETYNALDRTINKNWILIQEPKARKLRTSMNTALTATVEEDHNTLVTDFLMDSYETINNSIELALDSYVPDAEKEAYINDKITELRLLVATTIKYNAAVEVIVASREDVEFELIDD